MTRALRGRIACALIAMTILLGVAACDPTPPTAVLGQVEANEVFVGQRAYVVGSVSPQRSGYSVVLERGFSSGWSGRGTATTDANGRYRIAIRPSQVGIYRFRVRVGSVVGPTFHLRVWDQAPVLHSVTAAPGSQLASIQWTLKTSYGPVERFEILALGAGMSWVASGGATSLTAHGLINGAAYAFRVRGCNARGCGPWLTTAAVVPFGAPGAPSVSGSVNGAVLTWTWSTPAGNGREVSHFRLTANGTEIANVTGNSYSRTVGAGETLTLCVAAVNSGGLTGAQGCRSLTAPAVLPTVTIGKGALVSTPDCTAVACARVRVTMSQFAPGTYVVECWESGESSPFYTYSRSFPSGAVSEVCYYGYSGRQVWAVVGGVRSNTITW